MSSAQTYGATPPFSTSNREWADRFAYRLPHVFVGIVAYQDIPHEIYLSHMLWAFQTGASLSGRIRLSFGMATKKEQYRARNHLVQQAEIEGADFLLMIDDDQTLHEVPDMIRKFYELGKPIAGGLYYQRGGCYHPVLMKEFIGDHGRKRYRFLRPDEIPPQPGPVDVLGGGCHWIDMRIISRFKQPHWWPYPQEVCMIPDPDYGLDVDFCQKARALGYECWLHPDIRLGHLKHDREVIDDSTRPPQSEIEKSEDWQRYLVGIAGAQAKEV